MKHQFITYCKGRLESLKKTLPSMLNKSPVLIVCGEKESLVWCKKQPVTTVFTRRDFNSSYFKNCGLVHSFAEVVTFIDCDRFVPKNFCIKFKKDHEYLHHCKKTETHFGYEVGRAGNITVSRINALNIRGYDESMSGWGFDDSDFVIRLQISGIKFILGDFFYGIPHKDELRVINFKEKKLIKSYENNKKISEINIKNKKNINENIEIGAFSYVESRDSRAV